MNDLLPNEYYKQLVFFNGIKEVFSSFYNNKELLDDGFIYLGYDSYVRLEFDEEDQPSHDTEITKNRFFIDSIEKQRQIWFASLISVSEEQLIEELTVIDILYRKSKSNIDDIYFNYIAKQLESLIKDLRVFSPKLNHPVFNLISRGDRGFSFFQDKDLPLSFFTELYDIAISLDLIDDVEVSEEVFINVFTCQKPSLDYKLRFLKSNAVIAYFLRQIEVFFYNFNFTTVEQSQTFINKQDKTFKSTDLSAALSRKTIKNEAFFKKIDSSIEPLKAVLKT